MGDQVGTNLFNDQRGPSTVGGPTAADGNMVTGSAAAGIFVRRLDRETKRLTLPGRPLS